MLPVSIRLPYPVCTRFTSSVLCPSPHKHRVLYSVLIFPSAPLPSLHTFFNVMFVCFASQTPVFCSPSLFSSLPLTHSSLFILSVCFALKTVQYCFPWDFSSLMRLMNLYCFFYALQALRLRGAFIPSPALQFCMLCLFCFSFTLYNVFPAFFPSQRLFFFV